MSKSKKEFYFWMLFIKSKRGKIYLVWTDLARAAMEAAMSLVWVPPSGTGLLFGGKKWKGKWKRQVYQERRVKEWETNGTYPALSPSSPPIPMILLLKALNNSGDVVSSQWCWWSRSPSSEGNANRKGSRHLLIFSTSSSPLARNVDPFVSFRILFGGK